MVLTVDIIEDKIVIGARYEDNANGTSGAYVYNLDGTGEVKITASTKLLFGRSVTVMALAIIIDKYYKKLSSNNETN